MNSTDQFATLAAAWARHCEQKQFSSNVMDRLQHPAFPQLIALGPPAVPLIMGRLTTEKMVPWEFVLQEITGVKMIEDPTDFSPEEVRSKRLAWWDKERPNFLKTF